MGGTLETHQLAMRLFAVGRGRRRAFRHYHRRHGIPSHQTHYPPYQRLYHFPYSPLGSRKLFEQAVRQYHRRDDYGRVGEWVNAFSPSPPKKLHHPGVINQCVKGLGSYSGHQPKRPAHNHPDHAEVKDVVEGQAAGYEIVKVE